MYLGAHVLLPGGLRRASGGALSARHQPRPLPAHASTASARSRPIRTSSRDYSERFHWPGYNRTQQERAHQFYKDWTAPGYPAHADRRDPAREPVLRRLLRGELGQPRALRRRDHLRADPVPREEVPRARRRAGRASCTAARPAAGRRMAAQMFYPDEYNGCLVRLPRPDRLPRLHGGRHLQGRERVLARGAVPARAAARPPQLPGPRRAPPSSRSNRLELVLGTKSRSGQQWDIWEAVYSPVGRGRLSRSASGTSARASSTRRWPRYWRENYDLGHILRRDWEQGPGQEARRARCHIYVGDMDNYYLNNAVYLVEEFLKSDDGSATTAARSTTATAPSTAGTATPRSRTRSRACAITRCSRRRSWRGSRSPRRRART